MRVPSSPTPTTARRRHQRRRQRRTKSKMNPGGSGARAADTCCPTDPRFIREVEEEGGAPGVAAGSIHDHEGPPFRPPTETTAIPRASDLETLLSARKLTLILDLDHTLLNSTGFDKLSHTEKDNGITHRTRGDPGKGLFRLDSDPLRLFTKLRPFVRDFLEEASSMFEMYVYTLGNQEYARATAKLLDPDGAYFGERIVSSSESTRLDRKSLDVIPGAEPVAVVILDDSDHVWPENQGNLILMDRYLYFASSCQKFGYVSMASLTEMRRDEREYDGSLAVVLGVLKRIHQRFFESVDLDGHHRPDVREVIRTVRREVLRGCTVAFSRVIPLEVRAEDHPMWKLAEQLGAVCAANVDATVTHVVAQDPGTEKARWARENKLFLVNPNWIKAAGFRWCRPNEKDYTVVRGH